MPTLTNTTRWRTHPYTYDGYLFILSPKIVFQALVNQTSFSYPISEVAFDTVMVGAYTDVRPGMTVVFGVSSAAYQNRGRQRVRGITGGTIQFGESSQGSVDGEVYLQDNYYITVWEDFRLWSKIPRILADGSQYKDYNIPLGTNGIHPPPIANAGIAYADVPDVTGIITSVSFDGSGSRPVATGATIVSYLWEFPDGTPATSTDIAPTITFPAYTRFRYCYLTVIDSYGSSHTTSVPVYTGARDGGGVVDPSLITNFHVTSQTLRPEGQKISFEIYQQLDWDQYPDGTLVIYFEHEYYNGVLDSLSGPPGRGQIKFVGWLDGEPSRIESGPEGVAKTTSLTCSDIGTRLSRLYSFPQIIERKASPSIWSDMQDPDLGKYIHYLLHWHSTALEIADYIPPLYGVLYSLSTLGSDGSNLYDQVDRRARAMAHRFTCNQRGQLMVVPDPLLLTSPTQSLDPQYTGLPVRTSTVIVSLTGDDYSQFSYQYNRSAQQHWVRGSGLQISNQPPSSAVIQPFFCIAPGEKPGQGVSASEIGEQIVINQVELNTRIGHYYRVRANPYLTSFEVELVHGGDGGLEPAYQEWVDTYLDPQLPRRVAPFSVVHGIPTEVTISHDPISHSKKVRISIERGFEGLPATSVIYSAPSIPTFVPPDPGNLADVPPELILPALNTATPGRLLVLTEGIYVFRSTSFVSGLPQWEDISPSALIRGALGFGLTLQGDPYKADRMIIMGTLGFAYCDDVWAPSPVWTEGWSITTGGWGLRDMLVSPNRRDWIGWLGSGGAPSGHYSFWYTTNFFSSVTEVFLPETGNYNSTLAGGWFNTSSSGLLFVRLGKNIYRSLNWGSSWSLFLDTSGGGTDLYRGSQIVVPRTLPGRTLNRASRLVYNRTDSPGRIYGPAGVLVNAPLLSRSGDAAFKIHINPLDGRFGYILRGGNDVGVSQQLMSSSDGFKTWETLDVPVPGTYSGGLGSPTFYTYDWCWNYWASNPKYLIVCSIDQSGPRVMGFQFSLSTDGGQSWRDLTSSYLSWLSSIGLTEAQGQPKSIWADDATFKASADWYLI